VGTEWCPQRCSVVQLRGTSIGSVCGDNAQGLSIQGSVATEQSKVQQVHHGFRLGLTLIRVKRTLYSLDF
jgi:hypothetical protein